MGRVRETQFHRSLEEALAESLEKGKEEKRLLERLRKRGVIKLRMVDYKISLGRVGSLSRRVKAEDNMATDQEFFTELMRTLRKAGYVDGLYLRRQIEEAYQRVYGEIWG